MNIKNNKRRQMSREKIETVFIEMLQDKEISEITVSNICKKTELNRSTFYANYEDIYDLADKIRVRLEQEVDTLYKNNTYNNCGFNYLKLFQHIKENQLLYKTYFKLGYDATHTIDLSKINESSKIFPKDVIKYHIEFHKAGLNAIIKKWLAEDCAESPETMIEIIKQEYKGRTW